VRIGAWETAGQKAMEIGEVSAVSGDKPQAYADRLQQYADGSASVGSVEDFTEALGRSGSASSAHAERLRSFAHDDLDRASGGENLEPDAKTVEHPMRAGARHEDFAPIEVQAKALAEPDFRFGEAAQKGRHSQFPSFDELRGDFAAQAANGKEQARTRALNPSDPLEGAEWKDDPVAGRGTRAKYAFAHSDEALRNTVAGLGHVGEIAPMMQHAIFDGIGLPAALGTDGAFLGTGGKALVLPTILESSTAVSTVWLSQFPEFGPGVSFGINLINRGREGIDAGLNTRSVVGAGTIAAFGGRVIEGTTSKSNLAGEDLKRFTAERLTGFSDALERGTNIVGLREVSKTPGFEEPLVPRQTSAESIANETPTSIRMQLPTGSSGVDDIAGNGGRDTATAFSGGDAADVIPARETESGEVSRPSDATNVSGTEIGESTRDIADAGDIVRTQNAGVADAPKVEASASSVAGARIDASALGPTKFVDQIADARAQGRSPDEITNSVIEDDTADAEEPSRGELRRDRRELDIDDQVVADPQLGMAMFEEGYRYYNPPAIDKSKAAVTEAELKDQLKQHEGPIAPPDDWHPQTNIPSSVTQAEQSWMNAERAYLVVGPSAGAGGSGSNGSGEERRDQRRNRNPGSPRGSR
jgi:hypothetical protein